MEQPKYSEPELLDLGMSEWFLTYGDLMSLLLCFFVMLYAMSTLQVPKMQAAVESFRGSSARQEQDKISAQNTKNSPQGFHTPTISHGTKNQFQTTYANETALKGGVIYFPTNSDELNDEIKQQLNPFLEELSGLPFKIQITGHAAPNEKGTYRDSLDLSYGRAVTVLRYFVSRGMNQNDFRIYAAGFSEPVETDGIALRNANTCVDIKIIADMKRVQEQKSRQ
ncbi:MAG: OmpA family protein [Planctomycetaceae bacterium]|jgi:chemotaxis protein MotB|nr:OmpA family protein [Planctomycetaceae bacterium]